MSTKKSSFIDEEQSLSNNIELMNEQINVSQSEIKKIDEEIDSFLSNDRESLSYKQELLFSKQQHNRKISDIKVIKSNPYFGRIKVESEDGITNMYIGEVPFSDNKQRQIIYDWRAPVSGLFYQNQNSYNYNGFHYDLLLKRKILIENSELKSVQDVYATNNTKEKIIDEFLQDILNSKKNSNEFTDIIKSIQENQNSIIRDLPYENVLVQGVAGSGKTAIILHRLSYIFYNYPDIKPQSFLFIAPTNIFKSKLNQLNKKLQIDEIKMITLLDYYKIKINEKFYTKTINEKKNVIINYLVDDIIPDQTECNYSVYSEEQVNTILKHFNNKINNDIEVIVNSKDFDKFNYESTNLKNYIDNIIPELEKQKIKYQNRIIDTFQTIINHNLLEKSECNELNDVKNEFENFTNKLKTNLDKLYTSDSYIRIKNDLSSHEKEIINSNNKINDSTEKFNRNFDKINEFISEFNKNNIYKPICVTLDDYSNIINVIQKLFNKSQNYLEHTNGEIKNCEIKLDKMENSMFKLFRNRKANILKDKILTLNLEIKKNTKFINYYNKLSLDNIKSLIEINQKLSSHNDELNDNIEILNKKITLLKKSPILVIDEFKEQYNDYYKLDIISIKNNLKSLIDPQYIWNEFKKLIEGKYTTKKKLKLYRADAFILLKLANIIGLYSKKDFSYIYIDEAQDYNDNEIELIYQLEMSPFINIYGDINQKVFNNVHSRKNWSSLIKLLDCDIKKYELIENYRNTVEIVEHCNKIISSKMIPIGNSNGKVIINKFQNITEIIKVASDTNSIVITNSQLELSDLKSKNIECYLVSEVKGLEFPSVIVINSNFSTQEKYVSFTRSLQNLYIYNKD